MIRTLGLIAAASLLVCVVTLSAAVAITGPRAVAHGAWSFGPDGWGTNWDESDDPPSAGATTRAFAWSGGQSLTIDPPADVQVSPGGADATITVSGRASAVKDLEIADGVLRYKDGDDHGGRLTVTLAAPQITHVTLEHRGAIILADGAAPR
jgi:hypothetical protein